MDITDYAVIGLMASVLTWTLSKLFLQNGCLKRIEQKVDDQREITARHAIDDNSRFERIFDKLDHITDLIRSNGKN